MKVKKNLLIDLEHIDIRNELLISVKAQAPKFFRKLEESVYSISYETENYTTEELSTFLKILNTFNITESSSFGDNRYVFTYKTIYEEKDFDSAELFNFYTKGQIKNELIPHQSSYILSKRDIGRKFKYFYTFYGPFMVLTKKGFELISKQNFNGISIKPSLEKKLGGKFIESKDFFILQSNVEINLLLKGENEEGYPVPSYYPVEMRGFIENDVINNGGSLIISKNFYNFLNSSPLMEDVAKINCCQIEKKQ